MPRAAACAGTFYPAGAEAVRVALDRYRQRARHAPGAPVALVAPHAGWSLCGEVAAAAFAPLHGRTVKRVIHLGPSHREPVEGVAASGARAFETPLGALDVADVVDPALRSDPEAHRLEHALEVQLPFLQHALGAFEYVPLVIGDVEPERLADVLERLCEAAPACETLIVASSDLSHGLDATAAAGADRETLAGIEALATDLDVRRACGAAVLNGLAAFAARRGWSALAIDRRDSAGSYGAEVDARAAGAPDVAGPVVGYAAVGYHESP